MQKTLSILALMTFTVMAEKNDMVKECMAIKVDTQRLVCYDQLFKVTQKTTKTAPRKSYKQWTVRKEISKIDDSTTVVLFNESLDKVKGRFITTTPSMIIRCKNNHTDMYFNWGQSLGVHVDGIKAKVRLDKGKPKTYQFDVSTDFNAAFVRKPIGFIKQAGNADTMIVQMETAYTTASAVSFDISGLQEVIKPLRKACSW